jgi:hypothetical protein
MRAFTGITVTTCAAAAAVLLAGCGDTGSATATATHKAASPAAAHQAAAPSSSPTPAALAATEACKEIGSTLTFVLHDAETRAKAKHAQLPNLDEQGLAAAYAADDLEASAQTLAAAERAPGVTPGLASAEHQLLTASQGLYANYGQQVANTYQQQVLTELNVIGQDCGIS